MGFTRSCAQRWTISRSASTSSPRSNFIEAMNIRTLPPVACAVIERSFI
jgi:hypothetical protein